MATEPEEEGPDFIHPPNAKDDKLENGLMCFMNMDRECGPDCMAWTTKPSESRDLNNQQRNCVLIVSVERLGRHTGILAKLLMNTAADQQRRQQRPPPNPMGGS